MLGLVLDVVMVGLILLAMYFFLVFIVSMIYGISFQKALKKVQSFLSDTKKPLLEQDTTIFTEFYEKLKDVVGEASYNMLERKTKVCFDLPPYGICTTSVVPYFYFSCVYQDDETREILTMITEKIIVNHLKVHSYPEFVYTQWATHQEIRCPVILAYFARNDDELKRLKMLIAIKETNNTTFEEEMKHEE